MLRARFAFAAALLSLAVPSFASLTGVIIDRDGKPIPSARVSIFALETRDARRARLMSKTPERVPLATMNTDSKGSFKFDSPKEPVVDLQAEAKGYAVDSARAERDDDSATLILTTATSKQGTVTANGKPVAGALVIWIGGSAETVATTDAQGKYSVPDPQKWANFSIVWHPDYALAEDFYFGQKKAPTSFTLEPGVAVTGRVVKSDGNTPAAGAALTINNWTVAKSGDDGSYTIAHAPKKWTTIEARSGDLFAVRANNPKAPTAMKLGATGSLSGLVRDAKTQQPLAGVDVRVSRASNGMLRFGPDPNAVSAITDAKGAFTATGIHPGSYEIAGVRPGYSVMPVTISIGPSQRAQKTLAANPQARISGMVVDEEKRSVAGAAVDVAAPSQVMFGNFPGMEGRPEVVTGPDGRFTIYTAREGDVVVDALKKGFPSAKSSAFRVAAGERKTGVVLTIPRGVALTGRVTDGNGKPLSGVSVVASAAESGGPGGINMRRMMLNLARSDNDDENVQTGSDGTFSMRVKEGMYDILFKREGYAPASARGTQVNAASRPIEIKMDPGVEISGIVTRGGTPIDSVNIMAMGGESQSMATTGPDGRFTLADLAPGSYMVIANKQDDFVQQTKSVKAPAKDIAIDLPPGGRVTGHVVDKNTHQPITTFNAGVSMSRSGGGMMMMMPPMMKSFTTDDGSFVLDNVPTGTMQIVASAAGYTTARIPSVVVEEGKTTADIEVALDTGVKLTGRVTGPDGATLSGVSVRPDNGPNPFRAFMGESSTTTDANGEYTLDALEPGEKAFNFSRSGYLTESRTTQLNSKETRLDVQLSSGIKISGTVVTEAGAPVPDAAVRASSATSGGFGRATRTDASGNFLFEGVAPGHYSFNASKEGYAEAISRDVDVSDSSSPVRLTLKTGGVVTGHVSGLSTSDLGNANVSIRSSSGGAVSVPVDQSGNFRAEGAPTGTLRISADVTHGFSERRTTDVKNVELAPGGSVQVDLEFNSQTTITGRVTRNGKALSSAAVQFYPRNSTTVSTTGRTTTDDNGNYTVTGLSDASYNVTVVEQRLNPYTTTFDVHGSGTFDIDIKSASVRGRVTDSGTGDPIDQATVQLRVKSNEMPSFITQRTAVTDANGVFVMDSVASGSYTATADKQGYGSGKIDVYVGDSAPPDLDLRLGKNDGIVITVVDARDNRTIAAQAVVYDGSGAVVFDNPMMFSGAPEPIRVPVPPGQYRAIVGAPGYASQTISVTSPSKQQVGLTAGGTLIIHSSMSGVVRGRLVSTSGAVYVRPFDRDGIFGIAGASTQMTNIQPGTYKLEVLGTNNSVTKTVDVAITEGGVFTADI